MIFPGKAIHHERNESACRTFVLKKNLNLCDAQ